MATQYVSAPCKLTISSHLFARWYLFRHVGSLRHPQQVDLLTLKVVSESCDVGYLCANFSLPRPLCSQVRPDIRDRQTDVKQKHRLAIIKQKPSSLQYTTNFTPSQHNRTFITTNIICQK